MPTANEKREERVALVAQMRTILNAADEAKRPLTSEERQQYDKIESDVDQLAEEIEQIDGDNARRAKLLEREESLNDSRGRRTSAAPVTNPNGKPAGGDGAAAEAWKKPFHETVSGLMLGQGMGRREAMEQALVLYRGNPRMVAFNQWASTGMLPREHADLQVDDAKIGGTLVVPEEFVAQLIKFVDDMVFLRGLATVLPLTSADSVGVPTLDTDPADADWTSELLIGGRDTTMTTGKRNLHPHPLAKELRVSRKLLRQSAIPAEGLIRDRLGYKFSISEERGFLNGTGANQPLGVFTASAQGISTARDVSADNTTTEVRTDNLIRVKYSLKSQYQASPSLRWIFNRTVVRDIRKLKDGNGQYIWQAGIAGTPDTILEVPFLMSEYAPNTMTTGLYVGILGDFRHYWIAESLRMEMQRLDELYAGANQVGFVGRMELDGMPVLEEAFARVALL